MIKNIFVIDRHSQIKALGSKLKFQILNELILNPATCKQLADIFGISKQKTHYNLKSLLDVGLIEITEYDPDKVKEKYYRAKAKNYVIDFSVGMNAKGNHNNREIINSILDKDHGIQLSKIAAKILEQSLHLTAKDKLLIVTGEYNMPLVSNIILEASKRKISTTIIYRNREILRSKHEDYSLAAFSWDYEQFNNMLKEHTAYLNLNGESRYIPLHNKKKIEIRGKAFMKSRDIINKKGIKVAMMPGLIQDTLSENNIRSEINFWKSLDVDYGRLYESTYELAQTLLNYENIEVSTADSYFNFSIKKILCEYGSFVDNSFQSPVINIPGGEILIIPKQNTFSGTIGAEVGYIYGKKVTKPVITIDNNKITSYIAKENSPLIKKAIEEGGDDGDKVALICLGTNYNMHLENIDKSYRNKSKGLMTIYWGENASLGGNVKGQIEWHLELENPKITYKKGRKK
jgi:leucyl aminopeptidase (aminopeptidase T)/DNA-binding HxlR family transcriptional regulator